MAKKRSSECHITGLPYSVDFDATRKEQKWHGWTSNGAEWYQTSASYWKLDLNKGFVVSPQFNIPTDVLISVYIECHYYKFTSGSSTYTVGSSASQNTNATANTVTASVSRQLYTDRTGDRNFTISTKLQPATPFLAISASEDKSHLYSVSISYR